MGARQSKRSVDITTTPKKEGIAAEGGVVGDAAAPGDGKLERIEETDTKPTTNGIAPHTDVPEDKEKDKDDATEKEKDKEKAEEVKAEETKQESAGESPVETAEVTTPTEANPTSPNTATSPDSKEVKKKDKVKKKWSFRSISFSKKDKSKPSREEAPKNGDVTKEEPLAEGGEEAETGSATAGSPAEEKSAVSSPSAEEEAAPMTATEATPSTEAKEELAASAASSPAEEKKEEPTPSAPTPVPVEEKKEEVEKVEPEKKVVEVSPAGGQSIADPVQVSVFRVQPVATPSIIERKTSEDIPSLPPSSPPPTPIDPSPLQQAQQAQHAAATATALAEALKLPAQAADKEYTLSETTIPSSANTATVVSSSSCAQESNDPPKHPPTESLEKSPKRSSSSIEPIAEAIIPVVHAKVEALPVVDKVAVSPPVSENFESFKSNDRVLEAPAVVVDAVAKSLAAVVTKVERKDAEKSSSQVIECEARGIEDRELSKAQVTQIVESESRVSDGISEIKDDQRVELSSDSVTMEEMKEIVEKHPEGLINPETIIPVCSVETERKETVAEVGRIEAESVAPMEESKGKEIAMERTEKLTEEVVESQMEFEKEETEETRSTKDEMVTEPPESTSEFVLDSEEGPVPVSEEILVEAKPAVVIPEDDVEETADTDADVSKVDTESVDVIPGPEEDRVENEMESENVTALATEEILMLEESSVPDDITIETSLLINETTTTTERVEDERKETETSVESLPPPVADLLAQEPSALKSIVNESPASKPIIHESPTLEPIVHESPALEPIVHESPALEPIVLESPALEPIVLESSASNPVVEELSAQKPSSESSVPEVPVTSPPEDSELTNVQAEPNVISPPVIEAESSPLEICKIREEVEDPLPPRVEEHPMESSPSDAPIHPETSSREDASPCSIKNEETSLPNESETRVPTSMPENPSHLENVPSATRPDVPIVDPLPPEELSCPIRSNVSEITSELPVPVESAPSLRYPTETLLTPPRSPSPQSNVSIASGLTTSTTKDCSQTQLYDDQSNREFKMESVSISLNSYNESDIELKERLAESPAETVNQDESISCQLSNNAASSAAQEIHQSTPETETPVENNMAHETSTTESSDDAPKVSPPTVPIEAPASPPSAPAITEDVASVTKAIEEIDISDKAVAAATIECNTNEIIADGHHQNNINE